MLSTYDQNRLAKLKSAADHEQKSAHYARFGDDIVEWINPVDGAHVFKFRKQDPPLIKHKSGFTKALDHKIAAINLREDVRRLDLRRLVAVPDDGRKPWGRAQRILYNRGYKRLEDTCFRRQAA